jgi:3-dehydroquinate synthase
VSDEHVAPLYAEQGMRSLEEVGFVAELHVVAPGDQSKSLAQASALYDRLAAGGFARDSTVLALGGGMVSDLAGLVAATWMRGVRFVICPTTLEADIDASIGGKTAVNHPAGKNLIGAFHQPQIVLIDTSCLVSLPQRDLIAGMAESIKHAAIRDADFLQWHVANREAILAREAPVLEELIARNVGIKADVVAQDEKECRGIREALNFGHTIGHALEVRFGYERRHGECVALGMVAACRLSVSLGLLDEPSERAVRGTLEAFGLPVSLGSAVAVEEIRGYLEHDKKIAGNRQRFVLLDGLGRTAVRDDVPEAAVLDAVAALVE